MREILLEKVKPEARDILFRMLQYSLFEESSSDLNEMNEQALFEYKWFDCYFTEDGRDAYFIRERESNKLLGFIMVNTHVQRFREGHSISEFMVIPKYRRSKIGKSAALECFKRYGGNWEVSPAYKSEAAYKFWKHVIDEYTNKNNEFRDGCFSFSERREEISYSVEEGAVSDKSAVREAGISYGSLRPKKQGEYTQEDYYALPEEYRGELIDGVIYDMASPAFVHQRLGGEILFQIAAYIKKKRGNCIPMAAPIDVRLNCDDRTIVQPDILILCDSQKIRSWGIDGPPDFVLEITSLSTRRRDFITKLHKYADGGVREYWILDPEKQTLITYDFREDGLFCMMGIGGKSRTRYFWRRFRG